MPTSTGAGFGRTASDAGNGMGKAAPSSSSRLAASFLKRDPPKTTTNHRMGPIDP
ncbi:MAG: hypothetical protein WAP03_27375 [Methylorubrum rhodinum]|uniref:hypothetical protein n=1 Tax=Methylorubrum rhodinum TaxID=29428 RepID=UPI003BAFE028